MKKKGKTRKKGSEKKKLDIERIASLFFLSSLTLANPGSRKREYATSLTAWINQRPDHPR